MVATVTTAQMVKRLVEGYAVKRPVMMWGEPGVGKSAAVYGAGQALGIRVIDMRLVQMDNLDLRGMPYKTVIPLKEGGEVAKMAFATSSELPEDGGGFLFLDEFAQALVPVQNSASELILDRRIGAYQLPPGWMVVAASNERGHRAGTLEIPQHLKNRMAHFKVEADIKGWQDWAKKRNINQYVMKYLNDKPKMLHMFDPKKDDVAYPTPRIWEYVSDYMNAGIADASLRDYSQALLGKSVGEDFFLYIQNKAELPSYADVVASPSTVPIPKSGTLQLSFVERVALEAQVEHVKQVLQFFDRCAALNADFGPYIALNLNELRNKGVKKGAASAFASHEEVRDWCQKQQTGE